jgi:transcription factor IIIB subunit 2
MVWCSYCAKDQQAERDDINGFTCCTGCGRVLDDNVYGSDPTFTKTAGGQSQVEGNFVKDGQSSFGRLGAGAGRILGYQSDSHEKTIAKGKHEIVEILERLSIRPREDITTQAHRFYTIALERNFTRGRRTQQVAASCIYIVCR